MTDCSLCACARHAGFTEHDHEMLVRLQALVQGQQVLLEQIAAKVGVSAVVVPLRPGTGGAA